MLGYIGYRKISNIASQSNSNFTTGDIFHRQLYRKCDFVKTKAISDRKASYMQANIGSTLQHKSVNKAKCG